MKSGRNGRVDRCSSGSYGRAEGLTDEEKEYGNYQGIQAGI